MHDLKISYHAYGKNYVLAMQQINSSKIKVVKKFNCKHFFSYFSLFFNFCMTLFIFLYTLFTSKITKYCHILIHTKI